MSSGSHGIDDGRRELTAGQRKALEDKKGSRHADVIDTWDPTGLGSASELSSRLLSFRRLTVFSSSLPTVWHQ